MPSRNGAPLITGPAELYHHQLAGNVHPAVSIDDLHNSHEIRRLGIENLPWYWPPPGHLSLNKMFNIATPAANSTDTIVGQYRVPVNYALVINAITMAWTGADFPEFSWTSAAPTGMIFRLLVDGNPAPDWGVVTAQVGTVNTPAPVGPLVIRSNRLIQVIVNNVSLNPVNTFVAAILRGWIWPAPQPIGQ